MSEMKHKNDLFAALKRNNDRLLYDYNFYDKTDTFSIASMQSSIFDLDSSFASYSTEKPKYTLNNFEQKKPMPFKTRRFKFKEKHPENWLYSNPNENALPSENPIKWMRTIFDENEVMPLSNKTNLKQTLSKSQANLSLIDNFDFIDHSPMILSYKSVSDLKNIEITENLDKGNDNEIDELRMTGSKTAPGSVENITEFRSSFQDFIALARQQEEKLKAEVFKRKSEVGENRGSHKSKTAPSVKYIKNSRKSMPSNRFGFPDSNVTSNPSKPPLTRYSSPNTNQNKPDSISKFRPRTSIQNTDTSQKLFVRPRVPKHNNVRQSADSTIRLKLYDV